MDLQNLSVQQMQKVFKLCDFMSLQDIYVATTILEQYGWDVQKAVDEIVYTKEQQYKKQEEKLMPQNNQPNAKPQQKVGEQEEYKIPDEIDYNEDEDPYMINDGQYEDDQVDYQDFEYDYPENELEMKRKQFEEISVSQVPLVKTVSEQQHVIKSLEKDKLLANDYHKHRNQYQAKLLKRSEQLCHRILQSLPSTQSRDIYSASNKKILNNKKFIVYLHKEYKSKINFTFGTFMLNLIRSYLDEKYLLVFILHEDGMKNGKNIIEKILNQKEFALFVNNNCISYGMFDNSDDYEIIQKYIPIKDLPAFALFRYNKKQQKEDFVASYPLLSNGSENCLEWMAKSMGIPLKKKLNNHKKSQQQIPSEERVQFESISDILKEQNFEYEEIEKLYHMKRHESRMNKEKIKERQNHVVALRKQFESFPEPELVPSQSIQVKFRMPISGNSKLRVFSLDEKIQTMFDFISVFCQAEFEQPYCEFDLTQTFPTLSLKDKKNLLIKEVFEGSERENIIVKEI